jgi:hypothetical protein
LGQFIESSKKIFISRVQMFPFVLKKIGDEHRGRSFAIVIDEAHSSQGGKTAMKMNEALANPEDEINDALQKRMNVRKMLTNASYFAFDDLHLNAAVLEGLLADGIALLARFQVRCFDGIQLQKAIAVLLIAPKPARAQLRGRLMSKKALVNLECNEALINTEGSPLNTPAQQRREHQEPICSEKPRSCPSNHDAIFRMVRALPTTMRDQAP